MKERGNGVRRRGNEKGGEKEHKRNTNVQHTQSLTHTNLHSLTHTHTHTYAHTNKCTYLVLQMASHWWAVSLKGAAAVPVPLALSDTMIPQSRGIVYVRVRTVTLMYQFF